MLDGAPPPTLNKSLVARHQQKWRLHEYHLLLPEDLVESPESEVAVALEHPRYKPLSPGDPLRAYLPTGLVYEHDNDGMSVYEPGRVAHTFYHRCPAPEQITAEYAKRVREILISGQVTLFFFPLFVDLFYSSDVFLKKILFGWHCCC